MNKFPQFSGAVPVDDKSILDALRGSDLIRKAVSERDTHVLAFRKNSADKLAKLDAEAEIKFPKMRAELEAAIREARDAEVAWRRKADRAYEIQAALSAASSVHTVELTRLEAQLAETASPEISIFIAEMRVLWDQGFSKFEAHHETEVVNRVTDKRERSTRSNGPSVLARQNAIREAIALAEAMRLEPDQSTVSARLQQIRNELPAVVGI